MAGKEKSKATANAGKSKKSDTPSGAKNKKDMKSQTRGENEQDPKRRIGQYEGAGECSID